MQSQLHDMALWSLARRGTGLTLAALQESFRRGEFLRTHVLRPTWHFVDPADIHLFIALTAPRVRRLMASSNGTIGLTESRLDQAAAVIVAALIDGTPRTRTEIAVLLGEAGVELSGQSLAHAVMHAETGALIANGPMRGKQHTYRLLPDGPTLPTYEELLVDIVRRYARGHGPFRDKDFAWWTSLTLTDSRRAVALAELRPMDVGGQTYWMCEDPVDAEAPLVMLLSNFDEYISYARDPEDYQRFAGTVNDVMRGSGLLMVGGRLAGHWTRTISPSAARIVVSPSSPMDSADRRALEAEAAAFGAFVDREPQLTVA